jgi:tRNA(Ile)-lysidine synthase
MLHDPGRVVVSAVRRAAREAHAPLLLAVSGGLDSMALLHAMAASARSRIAAVATFDHGTGVAATEAAAHVAREAGSRRLPVVIGHVSAGESAAGGREAAWRRARYRFLRSVAESLGARIVTAHTEDDQVETVLMRELRGSGVRGLAGLYAPSDIVRPFVHVRRAVLQEFVRAHDVRWYEDPTNESPAFLRNRVRRDLLPALRREDPLLETALLDAARRAAAWRADVEAFVDERLDVRVAARDHLIVGRAELAACAPASLPMLWAALAGRMGLALDRRGTRRLASFSILNRPRGRVPLSGGWSVEASPASFVLAKRRHDVGDEVPLPNEGTVRWGDFQFRIADNVDAESTGTGSQWTAALPRSLSATVRPWLAGDRLSPAGGQPRRRVKRYLSDAGVHGLDRAGWPVVVAGDDVVWIPGVRRSDAATARSGRPVRHYVCERIDR